ncbi:MAG: hypothetical protein KA059_02990 [Elusimicrobiales bacterium]|nr:hypothetical protein [Elusimicrobiales bacterium]
MKKYIILVLIILIIVSGVYYLRSSKKPSTPIRQTEVYVNNESLTPNQVKQSTVSFEPQNINVNINYSEIASKQLNEMAKSSAAVKLPVSSYLNPSVPAGYAQTSGCGKNIDNILSDDGKLWGGVTVGNIKDKKTKTYTLSNEQQKNISIMLMDYSVCKAVNTGDMKYCNKIPSSKECKRIANIYINKQSDYYIFLNFIRGVNNDINNCVKVITSDFMSDENAKKFFKGLTPKKICDLVYNIKIENFCDKIADQTKLLDNRLLLDCYKEFPRNEADCGSDQDCRVGLAFMRGNPELCPYGECKIYLKGCEAIKSELELTYCDYYNELINNKQFEERKTEMNNMMKEQNKKFKKAPTQEDGGKDE